VDFIPADFHFLRPLWLLAAVPAIMLYWWLRLPRINRSGWTRAVDRSLLPHLLDGTTGKKQGWILAVLLGGWLLASLSLAGPSWEKLPQPVRKKADALVIIQDLSLSMYATDLSPNRLTRAGRKLLDILAGRREGTTALVVYSGDAHVVAPLTDDTGTISAMVPDLSPSMMPAFGSDVTAAVKLALRLLRDGLASEGRLLLITDEVEKGDVARVTDLLAGKDIVLSVLGVGTEDGAPIPKGDGGFLNDSQGNIIVPRLNRDTLRNLAAMNNGRYSDIRLDDADIDYLLAAALLKPGGDQFRRIDREFDQWREEGHWLVLALLPLALLAFRRGWLLGLIMILLLPAAEAEAMDWQDLWLRKDQQGVKALLNDDPRTAAELFTEPQWQGVAEYRAGNYGEAAKILEDLDRGESNYNRGNALARQGRLKEAIEAYNKTLQQNPELEDARYNKELVEKLMRQENRRNGRGQEQNQESTGQQQEHEGQKDQDRQGSGQEEGNQHQEQPEDQAGAGQQGENRRRDEQGDHRNEAGQVDEPQEADSPADQQSARGKDQDEQAEKAEEKMNGKPDQEKEQLPQSDEPEVLTAEERMKGEEQQALEQWLRRIPDNSGGFLKRKFEYQYRQNRDRDPSDNQKIW
jgi:Ca-activated chloride channel family protein